MKKIVALIGKDQEEILKEFSKAKGYDIDLFEIRADFLEDTSKDNVEKIIQALRKLTDRQIILTLRTKREGGNYSGLDYAMRVHSYLDLSMDYIDLQINELTDQAMKDMIEHAKYKDVKVVLSVHQMNRGVSKGIFQYYIDKAIKFDADIVKIVDMPRNKSEAIFKLLVSGKYAQKRNKPELLSISMGEIGVISRYITNLYKPSYSFINISDKINIGQFRLNEMDEALSKEKIINFYTFVTTTIGKVYIYSDLEGISQITFDKPRELDNIIDVKYETALLRAAKAQMKEYFLKERKNFELKLSLHINDLQKDVFSALEQVKYGQTISYKDLAEMAGHKGGARAVGSALADNPLPIIIPCHRVVKASGDMGDYIGGSYRKQLLLSLEKES
ncbi:MAG: type I 3-dehydroquinate dehydratase [Tissierellia bacterium]|nr:type I 3-dehydroquinate dehydratase [Tissierellia bacterium]